ncbi:hypothetical protein GQ44DRAFT_698908 [Phaeosphaeriaceae sp. PMI808]|nr:hypothetical protein GQ44DRAFT_698908 [Phaeosphaeriaceae sp. PMI808]
MAFSRGYIPSRALLRALSRPQCPQCPFAQPIPMPFIRGKRTRAEKLEALETPERLTRKEKEFVKEAAGVAKRINEERERMKDAKWLLEDDRLPTDKELEDDRIPTISWYEEDLDKGTPRRLISRTATAEDRKRDRDFMQMIKESYTRQDDPAYDPAPLNRMLLDTLIKDPDFADLTDALKEMKTDIKSKEEMDELEAREIKVQNANLKKATQKAIQDLLDDPDAASATSELQAALDRVAELENLEDFKFQNLLTNAMMKLNDDPVFAKKAAEKVNDPAFLEDEKLLAEQEREIDAILTDEEFDNPEHQVLDLEGDMAEMNKLMQEMHSVMKSMGGVGGNSKLQAELESLMTQDPTQSDQEFTFENMDAEELTHELKRFVATHAPKSAAAEEEEENVPADLQAKVDKIMEDPKLMEKLMYISKLIDEHQMNGPDMTDIVHETAPDPYELHDSETTTIGKQLEEARRNPEHVASLARLRVKLTRPFNVSPALKLFNQAIELAYAGANDDIRRILWRSYQKARTLPTFLQNLSDDAWDLIYYSQAVTWGANQNRRDHLQLVLADLKSIGRDGPPTHPSTFIKEPLSTTS